MGGHTRAAAERRQATVKRLREDGVTTEQIAQRMGLSTQQVTRIELEMRRKAKRRAGKGG